MNELTKLCLERCSEIECLTDETTHEDAVLRRLDELKVKDMDNLKQLCIGPSPISLFQKLERLSVSKCPQLLHIFPADCNLGSLKFLEISGCPMLTSIFPISAACTLLSLEELEIEQCNELTHVLAGEGGGDAWGNLRFPKLKKLSVNACCKLEYAFPVFLVQKFEQLQFLYIRNAPQMKFVFGVEQPMHDADETQIVLPPLEYLHLNKLPNLVGICSKKYCLGQSALKTITCWNCPNMKLQEIRGHQLRNEEYNPLTAIESIILGNCGAESVFPCQIGIKEQIPTFQYLQQLTLEKCARVKVVFSTHTHQCLPKLTYVTISCCEELEAIFMGNEETQKNLPVVESCLLKLKCLQISKCNKLKFILPFMIGATTSMLSQLSTLMISDCSQMEEIFKCSNIEDYDIDSEREIKFPDMKHMELKNLPRLVNICQGFKLHVNICQGFKLRTGNFCGVVVHECPKLMPNFNATTDWTKERIVRKYELKYNQLNNMEALNLPFSILIAGELDIQGSKVEHKWRFVGDDEQEETNDSKMLRSKQQMLGGLVPIQVLCFQYLHSLEVTHIKKLKFLFSMRTIVQNSLPKLNYLTLSDCEELEEIIAENEEHQTESNVQVGFPELRELKVERCNKLKRLFSMSAATIVFSAQSFPELISVTISQCEELEAVFSRNKETQNVSITESCLLKLKSLKISQCNKLQFILSFIISAATSMLPQLSTLNVSYCSQMEEIFKVSNIEDDIDNEREITFPNMKRMELKNLPRLVNVCQGFKLHTGEFYRVKVHDCPKFMPIKSATIDWTKETLVREYELKYSQLNNNEALNLPLSILIVGELDIQGPKVEHKWRVVGDDEQEETNDSKMLRSEQQMLGGLVPTQVLCFQYLHSLKVTDSKKLKFLFSMSTIVQNSLPKLYSLSLYDCEELEVIFGHSGVDDANYSDTIVLSSLRKIELTNLPNFMSVCQVELQIQVELSSISICNCPKFVDSSLGWALEQLGTKSVSTEESNVQISSNAEQLPGNGGKGMKMLISRAEELRLENSMNLTSVWERPTFIMFQNLKRLYVIKCRRLKCIMPTTATRSLPCLLLLEIEECEELEEVMSLEEEEEHTHFPNESSNSSLCFPQLYTIRVKRCMKLKWLFPSLPSTQRLPCLRYLVIEQCSELKGVCNSEGEIHEEGFYNNLLPKLQYLAVQDCPMFSETKLAALQRPARREDKCSALTLYESQLEYRYSI